ncbi:MAG TPA: hypothetical protein VK002_14045 [Rubricoccaceae bacterium]|jgi:rRNA maturation endonuclease Nob1|nr:hypothetical protein [Rubricoccaceae bacterium]
MPHEEPIQDEVMREVRAIREAYAARFDYDVRALFEHARRRVQQSDREVVRREPRRVEETAPLPDP